MVKVQEYAIRGSYGALIVDDSGEVIRREYEEGGEEAYGDIVRFDVEEYVKWMGFMEETGNEFIGFWTDKGEYFAPDQSCRDLLKKETGLPHGR